METFEQAEFKKLFEETAIEPDPLVYLQKFQQLADYGKQATSYLIKILEANSQPEETLLLAARLLFHTHDPEALPVLMEACISGKLPLYLVNALWVFGESIAAPLCPELLNPNRSGDLKLKIVHAVNRLEDDQQITPLLPILTEVPEKLRPTNEQCEEAVQILTEACTQFLTKYPQLSFLRPIFISGVALAKKELLPPFDTAEFEMDFNQAFELVVYKPDAHVMEAQALLLPFFEQAEIAADLVSVLLAYQPLAALKKQDDHSLLRAELALELAHGGNECAREALLLALKDPDPLVRFLATSAFNIDGGKFAEEGTSFLPADRIRRKARKWTDPDAWRESKKAIRAVQIISDNHTTPQLQDLERAFYSRAKESAIILHKAEKTDFALVMETIAQSEDEELVDELISSLGSSSNPEAIPTLIKVLNYPDSKIRKAAAESLFNLAWQTNDVALVAQNLLAILQKPDEETEVLCEVVVGLFSFSAAKTDISSNFNAAEAITPTLLKLKELMPTIQHYDNPNDKKAFSGYTSQDRLAMRLITALGYFKAEEAVDLLIEVAGDKTLLSGYRIDAVVALTEIRDARSFDIILQTLKDPYKGIREASVVALDSWADQRAFEPLLWTIYHDSEDQIVSKAIVALGKLKDQRAYDHLIKALSHEKLSMHYAAIEGLGELGGSQAIARLLEALADPDAKIKIKAIYALGHAKAVEALPLLEPFTENNEDNLLDPFYYDMGCIAEEALYAIAKIEKALETKKEADFI